MIILFDVDGTLVESGQTIEDQMISKLRQLKEKGYILGLVGGGTYELFVGKSKKKNSLNIFLRNVEV